MNLQRAVTIFGRVVLILALAGSGLYVLIYLWRWEWERAQIAGIFFISALIIFSTQLILRRIELLASNGPRTGEVQIAVTTAPDKPFAWTEPDQSTYIFLPVLLGFGVALSALAAAAERLVAFVVGGPGRGPRARQRALSQGWLAAVLVLALVATTAVLIVARHRLMTRPETSTPGERTYVLEIDDRASNVSDLESGETLALTCRDRGHVPELSVLDVRPASDDAVAVTVEPVLGRFGAARFEGCLVDAVLDRRSVEIVSITTRER